MPDTLGGIIRLLALMPIVVFLTFIEALTAFSIHEAKKVVRSEVGCQRALWAG